MNNITIFEMEGVPMVDTITIANVLRDGKTNNVYRMAVRLANLGTDGIIDLGGRPAKCALSQAAFMAFTKRLFRYKDERTALGIVAINNAFGQFMDCVIDDVETECRERMTPATDPDRCPNHDAAIDDEPKTPVIDPDAKPLNDARHKAKNAIDAAIAEAYMFGHAEGVKSMNARVNELTAELEAVRSELDALRRMVKPEPISDAVQTLSGNVNVQACAAWLTSNGIKDMGEIRLYEWMRQNGLVCSVGTSRNLPTQIALEKGLLVTVSNPYTNPRTGERVQSYTTRITPKGQSYLFNRLMYYQINPKPQP